MKKYFLLFLIYILPLPLLAQQVFTLAGRVTDSQGLPIPFASVYVKNTSQGSTANERGYYQLKLKAGNYPVTFRSIGYQQKQLQINLDHNQASNQRLQPEDYILNTAAGSSEDPALVIIRSAISKRSFYLNEISHYSCNVYIKGAQKLVSAPKTLLNSGMTGELVLDSNGRGILYQSEARSQYFYQQPDKVKEVMESSKIVGNGNAFNFNRASDLQVNFYKNIFNVEGLNSRGFISPIADNAFTYYTYKLAGVSTVDGQTIAKIEVIPLRDHDPVFKGFIYIIEGDWRIYDARLYVTKQSNINLVDTMTINQQYIPVKDGIWQPASLYFTYNGDILGFKFNGYILGVFSDYNLDPKFPQNFFNGEVLRVNQESVSRDSAYWSKTRPVPLTTDERRNFNFKDSIAKRHETRLYLDSVDRIHNKFSPVSYIFLNDTISHYYSRSSIALMPLYQTLFYNTVEGFVINLQPTYNKQLDNGRAYSITPDLRFGFSNQVLNVNSSFNYLFNPQKQGIFYGRLGSNIFDLNSEASVSQFVNTISTLLFKENYLKLYRSTYAMAGVKGEVARGLVLSADAEYAKRQSLTNSTLFTIRNVKNQEFTSNNPLKPLLPDTPLVIINNALTLRFSATYTFDEQYSQTPAGRVDEPSKYPMLKLNYRKGVHGLGSNVDYDYADIQVFQKHIRVGIYGYSSFLVTAGKFFNNNALSYPDYKQFKGNQGITFEPEIGNFHFLPYYTYTYTSFSEAHYEHNFSGFLFNKIPGLRNLKLEEIVGGNYLARESQPNFSELYIGVQRFFFRFDYGITFQGNGQSTKGIRLYYGF